MQETSAFKRETVYQLMILSPPIPPERFCFFYNRLDLN